MTTARLQDFIAPVRKGIGAGFTVGLIIIFLTLIGIPINIENLALFSFFFVTVIFSVRLTRRLKAEPLVHVIKNALALGLVAAFTVYLLMAQINRWQASGVDVKGKYFDAVSTGTTNVFTGVPESELFPNPARDPLTDKYPEGEALRTNPMRLTLGSEDDLHLKLGLAGKAWFVIQLHIGGFYGFLLLLVALALIAAVVTWAAIRANVGQTQKQMRTRLSQQPVISAFAHWFLLLLPLLSFVFLWLTVTKQPGSKSLFVSLGSSQQEVQLLTTFLIVISGLVAIRLAQPNDWKLNYPLRLLVTLVVTGLVVFLGIWRITAHHAYIIATSGAPKGSEALTVGALVAVGLGLAAMQVRSLRMPGRLEQQVAIAAAVGSIVLLPITLNQYQNDVLSLVGIYILLGLGLNIVVGYAGLLDLGYVAFFALGAYAYAFLSSDQRDDTTGALKFPGNDATVVRITAWSITTMIIAALVVAAGIYLWNNRKSAQSRQSETHRSLLNLPSRPTGSVTMLLILVAVFTSLIVSAILDSSGFYKDIFSETPPFVVGLFIGMLVSAIFGLLLGIPVLRLRGDYLAIVTLGFGEIIKLMFNNLKDYTGGPQGVLKIPRPLPTGASGPVTYLVITYLVLLGVALTAFFSTRLRLSRIGRAWNAMRSDEDIAQSMGVNLVQTKLLAFAMGAMFAGLGGVLVAARQRNIFPNNFTLDVSIEVLSLVIIGGMGSVPGVIIGAIVLIGMPEVLRELYTYRIMAFGALLVAMVILRPKGLLPMPPTQLQERARELAHRHQPTEESQP